jgi:hypothetical protein
LRKICCCVAEAERDRERERERELRRGSCGNRVGEESYK